MASASSPPPPEFKLPALLLPLRHQRGRSGAAGHGTIGDDEAVGAADDNTDRRTMGRLTRLTRLHVSTARFLKSCEQEWAGETALKDRLVNIARLGRGSTSNVWKAVDVETFQLVAVKEVKAASREAKALLVRELDALQSQLSPLSCGPGGRAFKGSSHIVAFFGSFLKQEGGDEICIAVEYVRGGSLQRWLEASQPAPDAWLAHMARQALSALRFLHQRHRIHRDIKPANMLLSKDGGIKLADFGIAVEAEEDGQGSAMAGTRRYMSCERLRAERYSYNSDVWSLGLSIAAVALGGCPVPQGNNEFDQLCFSEEAPALVRDRCVAAGRSPELLAFLLACLEVDPEVRPSAADLMDHPFLAVTPVTSGTTASTSGAASSWETDTKARGEVLRALTRRSSNAKLRDGVAEAVAAEAAAAAAVAEAIAADAAAAAAADAAAAAGGDEEDDEAFYARRVVEEVVAARKERFGIAGAGAPQGLDLSDLSFELNMSECNLRQLFSAVRRHAEEREQQRKERRSRSRTPDGNAHARRRSGAAGSGCGSPASSLSPARSSASASHAAGIAALSPGGGVVGRICKGGSVSGSGVAAVGIVGLLGANEATPRGEAELYSSDDEVVDGAATGRALYARSSPIRVRQRSSIGSDATGSSLAARSLSSARSLSPPRSAGRRSSGNVKVAVNLSVGLSGGYVARDDNGSCTDNDEVEASYFSEAAQTPSPRGEKEFTFGATGSTFGGTGMGGSNRDLALAGSGSEACGSSDERRGSSASSSIDGSSGSGSGSDGFRLSPPPLPIMRSAGSAGGRDFHIAGSDGSAQLRKGPPLLAALQLPGPAALRAKRTGEMPMPKPPMEQARITTLVPGARGAKPVSKVPGLGLSLSATIPLPSTIFAAGKGVSSPDRPALPPLKLAERRGGGSSGRDIDVNVAGNDGGGNGMGMGSSSSSSRAGTASTAEGKPQSLTLII